MHYPIYQLTARLQRSDKTLAHTLQQGKFCYVVDFEPQAGRKPSPSLCQRTITEMAHRGYQNVVINLNRPCSKTPSSPNATTHYSWDSRLIQAIWAQLHPHQSAQLTRWLKEKETLCASQRLAEFASDLLLTELGEQPIIIFIEQVENLLTIPTAIETLLDWIGHCIELRDSYLTYHHLNFAVFSALPLSTFHLTEPVSLPKQKAALFLKGAVNQGEDSPTQPPAGPTANFCQIGRQPLPITSDALPASTMPSLSYPAAVALYDCCQKWHQLPGPLPSLLNNANATYS